MAEYVQQPSEFVKLSGNDNYAAMARGREISQVWLWDCGPPKPVAPKRPVPPKGRDGDPEYDLAMIDFRESMDEYQKGLKIFGLQKDAFADFEKRYGGPYLVCMWSADAQDALANDARAVKDGRQDRLRYFISSRTRGYEKLPNGGLPPLLKPGHAHEDNLRREREGDADMVAARRSDPVFGGVAA